MTNITDQRYLRGRPFLLVSFTQRARANADTRTKGWASNPANMQTFEHVSIVDRVGNKQMQAAIIIDIIEGKAVRNTTEKMNEDVIGHYIGRYADKIKEALALWARNQITTGMVEHAAEVPDTMLEDYPSATPGRGSKVEVLPSGEDLGSIEDIEYFNKKLTEGLAIPRSDDHTSSGDERFG